MGYDHTYTQKSAQTCINIRMYSKSKKDIWKWIKGMNSWEYDQLKQIWFMNLESFIGCIQLC